MTQEQWEVFFEVMFKGPDVPDIWRQGVAPTRGSEMHLECVRLSTGRHDGVGKVDNAEVMEGLGTLERNPQL